MTPKRKQRCGQAIGYSDHRKAHEPACERCLRAYARYMFNYRHRTGRSTRTLIPDTKTARTRTAE